MLGLKDKDKRHSRSSRSSSSAGDDDEEQEEQDEESLARERERRQRAAELAELKEYREVLREELKSLWVAMRRPPAAPAALDAVVQGELDRARREALRLRRENDALVTELRDLDALILRAEEGIHVFAPSSGGERRVPKVAAGRRKGKEQGRPPRQHLDPTLEEVRRPVCRLLGNGVMPSIHRN